jgi:hypothetical protein
MRALQAGQSRAGALRALSAEHFGTSSARNYTVFSVVGLTG